jgi:glycosyltransferase involved in cell wall biosynthesis
MFKDKTILYIVHNYNSFQKDPIEEIAKNFKKVYVLVRYKPISKIARLLPFKSLKKYDDKYVMDLSNKPKNVEVIKTPVWYLPFGVFYKWLGELHFRAVDRVIKKNNIKFDLVHCHFLWSSGYVGMRLKQKYKKPFIVTGHGFDVYQLPFESISWKEKIIKILHSADKVITVNENNRELLLNLGIENKNIEVLSNSYNSKLFYPIDKEDTRKKLGIKSDIKVLLSVGNLESIKGHKYLIEAINLLREEYPDLHCYIIGGGSLYEELKSLIRSLNLQKNIFLIGPLLHDKINVWINACDIFVLPSLEESFGVVQLEAFSCGRPVVATETEGSKGLITSPNYGSLSKIKDSFGLADSIKSALKQNWEETKIIHYASYFKQDRKLRELLNIYENFVTTEK